MSLDVYLINKDVAGECESCGHSIIKDKEVFERNITHNLRLMADAAGIGSALWHPEELGIIKAKDLITHLSNGLIELKKHPDKYEKYDPPNGWGKYETLVDFVSTYLEACIENPEATIEVSR